MIEQQETRIQKLENTNLSLENEYFNSNQYLELAARQDFGLGAPGDKLIIVPESVAMSYTVSIPVTAGSATADAKQPGYQKNFQSWVDFFLHRQSGN